MYEQITAILSSSCFIQNITEMKCFRALLYVLLVVNALAYEVAPKLSFSAPFDQFNYSGRNLCCLYIILGNRVIEGWECGGDAVINEYFVRLTPDRQSKNGFCWSRSGFSDGEMVTTIKFRISGQVIE